MPPRERLNSNASSRSTSWQIRKRCTRASAMGPAACELFDSVALHLHSWEKTRRPDLICSHRSHHALRLLKKEMRTPDRSMATEQLYKLMSPVPPNKVADYNEKVSLSTSSGCAMTVQTPASGTLETIFIVSASRRLRPLKRVPPGRIGTGALPLRKTQATEGRRSQLRGKSRTRRLREAPHSRALPA